MARVNAGCGLRKKVSSDQEKWVNIDCAKEVNPDVICNLDTSRLIFRDDDVDFVFSEHSFEHFKYPLKVLKELYRVTKNGGTWQIIVPYGYNFQDNLFHYTVGFHKGSFNKFLVNSNRSYYHDNIKLELLSMKCRSVGWKKLLPLKSFLSQFLNNVYYEIEYNFRIVKELDKPLNIT